MISAVWDLDLDQYQDELMIYKQTEDKITDLQAKMKNSLCHLFCTQNEKKSHFSGWHLVTKGHVTT